MGSDTWIRIQTTPDIYLISDTAKVDLVTQYMEVNGIKILLILLWINSSDGLKCYSCYHNNTEASCDAFRPNSEWSVSCPPTTSSCVSTVGKFETVTQVTRECGPPVSAVSGVPPVPGGSTCRTRLLGGGASATICSCSSDLCNMIASSANNIYLVNTFII